MSQWASASGTLSDIHVWNTDVILPSLINLLMPSFWQYPLEHGFVLTYWPNDYVRCQRNVPLYSFNCSQAPLPYRAAHLSFCVSNGRIREPGTNTHTNCNIIQNSEACQCWRIVTPELKIKSKAKRGRTVNQFELTRLYCPNCDIYFDSLDQYHCHLAEVYPSHFPFYEIWLLDYENRIERGEHGRGLNKKLICI